MKNKNYKDTFKNLTLVSQIGLSVITPILLGVFVGQFIDKKAGTSGIFSIIFILLGTGGGFMNIFKLAKGKRKWKDE